MLRVDPWAYVFGAVLVLTLPLDWLLAALCAAIFHEVCHMVFIYLLGGRVARIHIGTGGTAIEAELLDRGRELLCALAGPAGSLLLVSLCRVLPKLAVCAGIQGLFNLLPVYPLDGGRALRCALSLLWPQKAEKIGNWVEAAVLFALGLLSAAGTLVLSLGAGPLIVTLLLIVKAMLRKRPCKRRQIRVQ